MKSRIVLTLFIGGAAWWLSAAADTAHEDDILGFGGSFVLSLANPLFAHPSYYVPDGKKFNKKGQPPNWSPGLRKALDDYGFDQSKNDILWQHGHAVRSHIVKVYTYPGSSKTPKKIFSLYPATAANPGAAVSITLSGSGPQKSVRLVMAKTGPIPLNSRDCVDIYRGLPTRRLDRERELRRRLDALRGRRACVEGHGKGTTSENMDYSWLILTDRKLVNADGPWTPLIDPNANPKRRIFAYPGGSNVKVLKIEVEGAEGGSIDLSAAECSFFQVCHNKSDKTSNCSAPPVITKDSSGACLFNGKKPDQLTDPLFEQ